MMVLDPYVTFYGLFVECGCCSMLLYDFYVIYVSYVAPFIMSVCYTRLKCVSGGLSNAI